MLNMQDAEWQMGFGEHIINSFYREIISVSINFHNLKSTAVFDGYLIHWIRKWYLIFIMRNLYTYSGHVNYCLVDT